MNEIVLPPDWQPFCAATRIPAAVRAGRTVYLSGHAGEGDGGAAPEGLERQVRDTFRTMEGTLRAAGAWRSCSMKARCWTSAPLP